MCVCVNVGRLLLRQTHQVFTLHDVGYVVYATWPMMKYFSWHTRVLWLPYGNSYGRQTKKSLVRWNDGDTSCLLLISANVSLSTYLFLDISPPLTDHKREQSRDVFHGNLFKYGNLRSKGYSENL